MLFNMKNLLKVATENHFAVGAFNIASAEFARLVIATAEKNNSPVILEVHPEELAYAGEEFALYLRQLALKASVPVVLHLDHGSSMEEVIKAVKAGFTSVMIDASTENFEENIRITKEVVDLVKPLDISVEAELGTLGVGEGTMEGGSAVVIYTDPQLAKEFVERTNVDTLAVAIGTAHGFYPSGMTPKLDLPRLKEIHGLTDIPLVLHGGSGNKDEEVAESITLGVGKVNISSDMKKAFFLELEAVLKTSDSHEPNSLFISPAEKASIVVENKMRLFQSIGKAKLYN
ncbi:ketose-bisphosphate aldolase [Vibrio litoralis]|uniref:ketose-bisphosphate aldolase n=1 Tax=Vibrio litoralis TaxID=335972 RepID=UPI00186877BB|nr:ketose-bisphosphate aldolase [Vibrio litoralis]